MKFLYAHLNLQYYANKALELYLDGSSLDEVESKLCEEMGRERTKSQHNASEYLRNAERRLYLPYKKSDWRKNKEQILKNRDLYLEHKRRLEEFLESEEKRLLDEGFKIFEE